jgi:hypothetical protein
MVMPRRSSISAITLTALLGVMSANAPAHDAAKYPDMHAQWTRIGSASYDPNKPGGRGQEAPLTPEYQAKLEVILANRAAGSLEGNATANCIPSGMPRAMIVYETMQVIVQPEMTHVRMSYMNELRRIFTDGRTWPEKVRPSFVGTSIGRWLDEDRDGRFDVLEVETRGFKGPRTFDGTPGIPLHEDNQTVVNERVYLNKTDQDVLHIDITVRDNALSRPWTVNRKYARAKNPYWSEYVCEEGNQQLLLGKENYMISADGFLMPIKKGQLPPDLQYFEQAPK